MIKIHFAFKTAFKTTLIKALILTTLMFISFNANSLLAKDKSISDIGKRTYEKACSVCHAAGVAGAPQTGDIEIWIDRLDSGKEPLYTSAINGRGAMPAKGGQTDISDGAIKAAVDYMISKSQ